MKLAQRTVIRVLSMLLCICLAGVCLIPALGQQAASPAEARTVKDVDSDIKACEALLSRLQSEYKELQASLGDLSQQEQNSREKAELTAGQIVILEAQISLNESLLESCDMKRSTTQAELFLVQNEYEYYQELFAELMRFVYENGNSSDFELLFSSQNLSDYLERRDNFNSIMECVSDLQQSMEQSIRHLQDLETEYNEAEEKYTQYLDQLGNDKEKLKKEKEAYESSCTLLQLNQTELTGKYEQLSKNIQEAKEKLEQLKKEREVLRKAEQQEQQSVVGKPNGTKNPNSGFIWPLSSEVSYRISSYFSTRINPITGVGQEFHHGLDIACVKGSKILAAKAGVVTKSAWYGGYGNCVILYHGKDAKGRAVTTLYGHASALKCTEGQQVAQGDVIALVGSTGDRSTGNHLHFSVLLDGVYVDPDDYLPDGFYKKMENAGY